VIGVLILVILFVFFKYGERIERRLTRRNAARPIP
jgi:predicted PurR-regulated permease PerM